MYSVTQRIASIKQPYGGYIRPKDFTVTVRNDKILLNAHENIRANLVGLAVDYLTRFMSGTPAVDAFSISLFGSMAVGDRKNAERLVSQIKGLDDQSIINACKVVGYDVCYRAGIAGYKPVCEITPDTHTIQNIRTMVKRSLSFWNDYGPVVVDGFTFEGGYTHIISAGDGDYLTEDTLWDFKVSKETPKSKHTLQLLIYYIMGCHSVHKEFQRIRKLGIFNPRLNAVYLLDIASIGDEIIQKVSTEVIGYNE